MGKNLKLDDLTVQSFVTSMNEEEKNRIKGGEVSAATNYFKCTWAPIHCPGCLTCTGCGDQSTC